MGIFDFADKHEFLAFLGICFSAGVAMTLLETLKVIVRGHAPAPTTMVNQCCCEDEDETDDEQEAA
jgi:hypothetical protein